MHAALRVLCGVLLDRGPRPHCLRASSPALGPSSPTHAQKWTAHPQKWTAHPKTGTRWQVRLELAQVLDNTLKQRASEENRKMKKEATPQAERG